MVLAVFLSPQLTLPHGKRTTAGAVFRMCGLGDGGGGLGREHISGWEGGVGRWLSVCAEGAHPEREKRMNFKVVAADVSTLMDQIWDAMVCLCQSSRPP